MRVGFYVLAPAVLFGTSAANAQMTVDVSKITCKQLITYEVTDARTISIWLSGFFNAQQNNTIIDVSRFRSRSNALKDFCMSHHDVPVIDAAKTVLGGKKQ